MWILLDGSVWIAFLSSSRMTPAVAPISIIKTAQTHCCLTSRYASVCLVQAGAGSARTAAGRAVLTCCLSRPPVKGLSPILATPRPRRATQPPGHTDSRSSRLTGDCFSNHSCDQLLFTAWRPPGALVLYLYTSPQQSADARCSWTLSIPTPRHSRALVIGVRLNYTCTDSQQSFRANKYKTAESDMLQEKFSASGNV